MTKLDFDKERTPGPKHYLAPDNYQEPLVQDKLSDREEVQVLSQKTAICLFLLRLQTVASRTGQDKPIKID